LLLEPPDLVLDEVESAGFCQFVISVTVIKKHFKPRTYQKHSKNPN